MTIVSLLVFSFISYISDARYIEVFLAIVVPISPLLLTCSFYGVFTEGDDSSVAAVFARLCCISGKRKMSPRDSLPPPAFGFVASMRSTSVWSSWNGQGRFSGELPMDGCLPRQEPSLHQVLFY